MPEVTALGLSNFLAQAESIFGTSLKSAVLYGSAAEGHLRPASDVNLLLVLNSFDPEKAAAIRGPFTAAQAAIKLTAMFLLETEIQAAMNAFGQKFSDLMRRHRVLYGPDPFEGLTLPRADVLFRLKQVLLNSILRMRLSYIELGSAPERVSILIADSAGPLRSCAATLRELEGKPALPPKEALIEFVRGFEDSGWDRILAHVSETRERQLLSVADADQTLIRLIELAGRLRARAAAIE